MWVANLADDSIRERGFVGHIHDDGMTGRSAISPDGRAAVFGVSQSTLAPPFLIDNYTSKGERLVVVDVQTLSPVAEIDPPHNESPLAIAVDYRDGKTTLLVNWAVCWKYHQFPEKQVIRLTRHE